MPIPVGDWALLNPVNAGTPVTIASATTIVPVGFFTILTGNTVVATITPPVTFAHMLAIQFAGIAGVNAAGNVLTVTATVSGQVLLLVYNPATAKYVPVG